MTNDVHTIGALMSNLLRNVSLHAAVNHRTTWAEHLVIRLHRLLGLDPDDPRTTKGIGHRYFINDDGEDGRPMPFHFLLILPALGWAAAQTRRAAAAPALAACIVAGALLFCLVLKWQPYHARLHLPLFVLSAPLVALLFQPPFGRVFLAPVFLLFTWAAWPGVFNYEVRPALGRHSVFRASHDEQQYRTNLPLLPIYPPIVRLLLENHVQEVGFISDKNQWEYPIAAYGYFHGAWRTDDMLVRGCYASLETTRVPDALVCTRAGAGENLSVHGRAFRRVYTGMDPATGQVLAALYLPVQVPSR
jgi:hypothetical protein